ncbi:hypothetical protein J3R83DRAFT_12575 [Lanmaoa asiatica]|nr:hypothetical protein J3R83DRAFT_12575 [Lanmaoa asiatica]
MSKRRKKTSAASDSEVSLANPDTTTKSSRACVPCRNKKLKCEYTLGSDVCRRCTSSDPTQCIPQPLATRARKTRAASLSIPPSKSQASQDAPTQETAGLAIAGAHKRPGERLACATSKTKGSVDSEQTCQQIPQSRPTMSMPLLCLVLPSESQV